MFKKLKILAPLLFAALFLGACSKSPTLTECTALNGLLNSVEAAIELPKGVDSAKMAAIAASMQSPQSKKIAERGLGLFQRCTANLEEMQSVDEEGWKAAVLRKEIEGGIQNMKDIEKITGPSDDKTAECLRLEAKRPELKAAIARCEQREEALTQSQNSIRSELKALRADLTKLAGDCAK